MLGIAVIYTTCCGHVKLRPGMRRGRMRRSVGNRVLVGWILLLVWAGTPLICAAQQTGQAPAAATPAYKPLTVDRIYSEPNLSGRLTRGIAWTPDSKQISFFESNATGKVGRTELWAVDVASGQRRGDFSAGKFELVFAAEGGQSTQAPRAGRELPDAKSKR